MIPACLRSAAAVQISALLVPRQSAAWRHQRASPDGEVTYRMPMTRTLCWPLAKRRWTAL